MTFTEAQCPAPGIILRSETRSEAGGSGLRRERDVAQ